MEAIIDVGIGSASMGLAASQTQAGGGSCDQPAGIGRGRKRQHAEMQHCAEEGTGVEEAPATAEVQVKMGKQELAMPVRDLEFIMINPAGFASVPLPPDLKRLMLPLTYFPHDPEHRRLPSGQPDYHGLHPP